MRKLPLLLLLFTTACPEETALQCPPNTSLIGQYALDFKGVHDAGKQCIADDGGPDAATPLTADDLGTRGATFCSATAADGGIELQFLVAGKGGVRKADLLPDGGFHFEGDPVVVQGTACVCEVSDLQVLDGFLLSNGPFALRPDGGLPPVTGVAATLVDSINISSSDAGCICNLPCTLTYNLTSTPF